MEAKNSINKRAFNAAIRALVKYNQLDDQRNKIDGEFGYDSKQYERIDRKCQIAFDKYQEWCDELPQYEVKRIEKSELY